MKCACDECGRSGGYALYCLRCAEMFIKQSEQEPVGKFAKFTDGVWREVTDGSPGVLLYTAPPQPKEKDNDGRCQDFYPRYCLWDRRVYGV